MCLSGVSPLAGLRDIHASGASHDNVSTSSVRMGAVAHAKYIQAAQQGGVQWVQRSWPPSTRQQAVLLLPKLTAPGSLHRLARGAVAAQPFAWHPDAGEHPSSADGPKNDVWCWAASLLLVLAQTSSTGRRLMLSDLLQVGLAKVVIREDAEHSILPAMLQWLEQVLTCGLQDMPTAANVLRDLQLCFEQWWL